MPYLLTRGLPPCFYGGKPMSKRIITALLAVIMLLGMFSTTAFAASTEEEALGEVDIYNGGSKYSYLAMNGKIQTFV